MEVDAGGSACSGSWPALVADPAVERTVSPRALIARGPVTRHVRARRAAAEVDRPRRAKTRSASEAVIEPPSSPSPAPRQVLYWRAGVIGVVVAVAASLLVVANGAPTPTHEDEPLAAVGAASPETATALQPKEPEVTPPADGEALVEEVLFIEDDLDDEPNEPPPTDAVSAAKSESRSHARDAARLLTARARAKRAAGDVAGAERLLQDALEALPTYAPAAADLATFYIHRGDYPRALAYAKRASRSAPRKLSYMVLVGDAQHLVGNHPAAVAQWRRAAHYGSSKAEQRLAKHGGG